MVIPDHVRINGLEYSVSYADNLNDGINMLCGQIAYGPAQILLSSDESLDEQTLKSTLWHEILHGLFRVYNLETPMEEEIVEALGKGIYQVIADNEERLFHASKGLSK